MIAPLDSDLLRRLETLRLAVRSVRWGSRLGGRYTISRRGSSIEFSDYTPYTPGDDIRAIDWKLYARLDRLFIKTYKEDIELSVEIVIDATASMALPAPAKFERASFVALALAYIALADGHQVRVSWMKPGPLLTSAWHAQRAALTRLTELAAATACAGRITMSEWLQRSLPSLRMRGGQALVISDWMHRPSDCFQALYLLRQRHLDVKAIQVLTPEELQPSRLFGRGVVVDSETGVTHELAYSPSELERAVLQHNEQLVRFCKRHGIPFVQHRLDERPEQFLTATLPGRGILE